MKTHINIFWFRRDLRLHDNAGLYHALKAGLPLLPIFIFDKNILDELDEPKDGRLQFIYEALIDIQQKLQSKGSSLDVRYGFPQDVFKQLLDAYDVQSVFTNHDYEPYARQRDQAIETFLKSNSVGFHHFKDQVVFDTTEVVKDDGKPYTVFTPYSRAWKARVNDFYLKSYPSTKYFRNLYKTESIEIPAPSSFGFETMNISFPAKRRKDEELRHYDKLRDFPALNGTSRLSVHLRFGTISIRELAKQALAINPSFLNELIWREFYQAILWHFPQVIDHSFKPEYDKIQWRNNEKEFNAWCAGQTGYPIVDAGMRQLNETGYMHNRVRMITASFLTKHLLIDWRWGEGYFAKKLLDYDLASNNGGWQWAAGSGCDAAPYFRIFNPYIQTKKFDPELTYIRKWVPEFEEFSYPAPIVEHDFARKRCLEVYGKALKSK